MNRLMNCVLTLTLIAFGLWGCGDSSTASADQSVKTTPSQQTSDTPGLIFKPEGSTLGVKDPELPLAERQKLGDRLFEAAQLVVDKTHDPEAIKILAFLKKNAVLAEPFGVPDPNDQPVRISDKESGHYFFSLVPLVTSDVKLGGAWTGSINRLKKERTFGAFQPDNRMMIVHMDQEVGQVMIGVTFLHEGYHAMNYLPAPHDWQDHKAFSRDERDTHEFQNRLMSKLGGQPYTHFVAKEAKSSLAKLKSEGKLGQSVPAIKEYQEAYKIFGQPKSDTDKDLLNTSVWVDIVFHTIDLYADKATAKEEKARFMYSVYRKLDSLPK